MSEVVCFLPGLICDARIFAAQSAAFSGSFVIDGFGARTSLGDMAAHVLATGPERMAMVGHSMGGRVVLEVWRRAPERVSRLALVSTGVHLPSEGEAGKRHALRDLGREHGAAALVDRWLPPMLAPANAADRALVGWLRAMCIDAGVAAFAAQSEALLARPEVETLLPTIDCPVLVAVGSEDVWSPSAQHVAIAAAIRDATLTIVPGAGHMLPAEAADALNAALAAWLACPPTRHSDTRAGR